jgi:hypothetical protein
MPPRPFYEIDKTTYLFSKSETPEEKIRQWVLFELLSTYGISIQNIRVEVPVKMGSKNFRADIVVMDDSFPYVVIECKEETNEDIDGALKQSISYANFLSAEFAACTNGVYWVIKRRVDGKWYPVADVPKMRYTSKEQVITSKLWFVHNIEPILYWIYQTVPPNKSGEFFSNLLQFFQQEVKPSQMLRKSLYSGTDNLLRILADNKSTDHVEFENNEYKMEKIQVVHAQFSSYCKELGESHSFEDLKLNGYHFREILGGIDSDMHILSESHIGLLYLEALTVRMVNALIAYLWQIYKAQTYKEIPPSVMREIENFINEILKMELGARLPDTLDTGSYNEMRILSRTKWETK